MVLISTNCYNTKGERRKMKKYEVTIKNAVGSCNTELFKKMAMANLKKNKKGRPLYKRYGKVRKEYRALMKLEKQNKKLGK